MIKGHIAPKKKYFGSHFHNRKAEKIEMDASIISMVENPNYEVKFLLSGPLILLLNGVLSNRN